MCQSCIVGLGTQSPWETHRPTETQMCQWLQRERVWGISEAEWGAPDSPRGGGYQGRFQRRQCGLLSAASLPLGQPVAWNSCWWSLCRHHILPAWMHPCNLRELEDNAFVILIFWWVVGNVPTLAVPERQVLAPQTAQPLCCGEAPHLSGVVPCIPDFV